MIYNSVLKILSYVCELCVKNAFEILSHIWIIKPWSFLLFDRPRFLRYMYITTPTPTPTPAHTSPTVSIITVMPWPSALSEPLWVLSLVFSLTLYTYQQRKYLLLWYREL